MVELVVELVVVLVVALVVSLFDLLEVTHHWQCLLVSDRRRVVARQARHPWRRPQLRATMFVGRQSQRIFVAIFGPRRLRMGMYL